MKPEDIIRELEANKNVFRQLLAVSERLYKWRPVIDSWCLLEILCHLYDEEREDFRARTKLALSNGQGDLISINPVGWVLERNYIGKDYRVMLDHFLEERMKSLQWLSTLENPDWSAAFQHAELGVMTAKNMLANWLAHDYHHIRQINALKYQFLKDSSGEDLSYAGNWKP